MNLISLNRKLCSKLSRGAGKWKMSVVPCTCQQRNNGFTSKAEYCQYSVVPKGSTKG